MRISDHANHSNAKVQGPWNDTKPGSG